MISVAEARARLMAGIVPTGAEEVPLRAACGRVLADIVRARRTQPPFAASAMDGYAVRRAEAGPGMTLRVVGEAAAGRAYSGVMGPGEAVRIFTGAPVPPEADDILIQEDADRVGDRITVREGRDTARHIRPAGGDFGEGDALDRTGPLRPQDIALLAAMNHERVPVRRRPVVALIPTGDELVWPGQDPGPDQIVSSNNFGLAAMLEAAGAEARLLPVARDTAESLTSAYRLARGADLIVTLGGASVGDHDLVQDTAVAAGMTLDFYKIAMRPGKPLMAGMLGGARLIGLPGNPVSAMVCGILFVRPVVQAMLGLDPALPVRRARLAAPIEPNGPREHYMRARLRQGRDGLLAEVADRQDSSLLSVLQGADALAIRAPHAPAAAAGDPVDVIPLD